MENLVVIKKLVEPTAMVHSLVVSKKTNKKIRVCLDPSNGVVMREHFPMQTMEDVISRIPHPKVFSILDAFHGFWQVKLSTVASWLPSICTLVIQLYASDVRYCPRGVSEYYVPFVSGHKRG